MTKKRGRKLKKIYNNNIFNNFLPLKRLRHKKKKWGWIKNIKVPYSSPFLAYETNEKDKKRMVSVNRHNKAAQ